MFPSMKPWNSIFPCPIRIDNDMNAAALGEKVMGAGRNISHLIYVSVETGIGAGIIIDGPHL
ncbi:MAG: ROK family protein [Limnochordia bacterium]